MDGGREREREEGKEGRRDGLVGTYMAGLVGTYMAGLVVSLDDNLPCTQALLYYLHQERIRTVARGRACNSNRST